MARLVIVSNRVSLPGERVIRAGGLAVAMRDALRQHGGIWFGWSGNIAEGSSAAPNVVTAGKVTYVTVDLSQTDHDQYYVGYANSTLWPLLHYRLGLVEYHRREFDGYLAVNRYLAKTLHQFLQPGDLVWVHDYHLIPLAAELRKLGTQNRIGFFLHTPLPPAEILLALPHHAIMMRALCAYDLVGFQTHKEVRACLDYLLDEAGGSQNSDGSASAYGRKVRIAAFPISIDVNEFAAIARGAASSPDTVRLQESLGGRALIVGVDRLDYSKGIPNRFDALDGLLSGWPEYRGKITYLQVTPYSRSEVAQYRALRRQLESAAGRLNGKYAEFDWMPVRYINRSLSRPTLAGFYRVARIGLVTPLRDGMNLVAKEYVAAQDAENPGVLILSRFAGAACELTSALLVNPFDIDELTATLDRGLRMPLAERRSRWSEQMATIQSNTIATWRENFLEALADKSASSDSVARPSLSAAPAASGTFGW